jgi:MFS family permease
MPSSARALTKAQTRDSLGWFNWNVSLRGVFETIGGGTTLVFVAYTLALGVPPAAMGYFAAAISLACILQVLGLPLLNHVRRRKRFILTLAVVEPVLVILAVLLTPLLPAPWRPVSLGVAVFLAAACLHLTRPFADNWLAMTIPSGLRGRYTGRRIRISSFAIILSTLLVGIGVEVLGRDHTYGLAGLLALGALFGVGAALTLARAARPLWQEPPRFSLSDLGEVLRTRAFMRVACGTVIWMLPFFFASAYYQVFNLEVVGMRPGLIAAMGVGYLVVKLLATPGLGRLCDRWGPRRLMWFAAPIYVGFFMAFPLAGPGQAWPLLLAWAVVGLADGIVGVAVPAALYGTVPDDGARPAYFAVFNLINLGGFALGGLLAVPLVGVMQTWGGTWGPLALSGYHLFYTLCGLAMVPCTAAIALMPVRAARQAARRAAPGND